MNLLQILAFPITLLYGLGVRTRNFMFDKGWRKSTKFDKPVICVGNLNVGGTGKTPHIEYLIRLLKDEYKIATLSRGYKRKTSGFILAKDGHSHNDIGDEPLQFHEKFGNEITVAVDENRVNGINQLLHSSTPPEIILMDDGFQHRQVTPSFSIILTSYGYGLYSKDYLLPSGRLREPRKGANRADVIIVTKCDEDMKQYQRDEVLNHLKPQPHQKVFFTYFDYKTPKHLFSGKPLENWKEYEIVLMTGIANPDKLELYLYMSEVNYHLASFPDHHDFTDEDLKKVRKIFDNIAQENKVVLTTEKDAVRLASFEDHPMLSQLPIYYLAIEVAFLGEDGNAFDKMILTHVR